MSCCPYGRTGTTAPRAAALAGAVPVVTSLVGWLLPQRGHLLARCPCRCCLCPQASPLQAIAMPVSATPTGASHARGWLCLLATSPYRRPPLRPPLWGPWLQSAAPTGSLAAIGSPCKGPGRSQPPL
ncbi:hypothetical protein BHE74_00007255 [Ensete ventricosum]|nr:hypothetical protein BHE74_00007255 [Ensete ventricosum]